MKKYLITITDKEEILELNGFIKQINFLKNFDI